MPPRRSDCLTPYCSEDLFSSGVATRVSDRFDDLLLLADRGFQRELHAWACAFGDKARQVLPDMAPLTEKNRNHPDGRDSLRDERAHRLLERRPVLEICQADAERRKLRRDAARDALERTRPLGIARSVGDENDPLPQCSVARRPS